MSTPKKSTPKSKTKPSSANKSANKSQSAQKKLSLKELLCKEMLMPQGDQNGTMQEEIDTRKEHILELCGHDKNGNQLINILREIGDIEGYLSEWNGKQCELLLSNLAQIVSQNAETNDNDGICLRWVGALLKKQHVYNKEILTKLQSVKVDGEKIVIMLELVGKLEILIN